jgi:hypothetical protein
LEHLDRLRARDSCRLFPSPAKIKQANQAPGVAACNYSCPVVSAEGKIRTLCSVKSTRGQEDEREVAKQKTTSGGSGEGGGIMSCVRGI